MQIHGLACDRIVSHDQRLTHSTGSRNAFCRNSKSSCGTSHLKQDADTCGRIAWHRKLATLDMIRLPMCHTTKPSYSLIKCYRGHSTWQSDPLRARFMSCVYAICVVVRWNHALYMRRRCSLFLFGSWDSLSPLSDLQGPKKSQ